jgi:hypothetical protein
LAWPCGDFRVHRHSGDSVESSPGPRPQVRNRRTVHVEAGEDGAKREFLCVDRSRRAIRGASNGLN